MSVIVDVIKDGYSIMDSEANVMKANCTCTLIKENNVFIVVDTLTAWDRSFLEKELESRNIKTTEITHVVGTHGHSDHIGNLNLFENAQLIVGQSISHKDEYLLHSFEEEPYKISENIEIIATPGHTLSDVSVIVKNTCLGTIAVVGDLFERKEDIENPDLWKITAGSENPSVQIENRNKILHLADYIVPGHGPMFQVTEELIKIHECQKE
ncbi:metallo-beta-lactamase domain-containing protein 1 [Trichonephila clavata]|uniref:Metallo-beta-lactamase domain-containing protein 1 n=1 Tax=Trichonephila clavata TaxID=2740835 RepID=A0A8X6LFM0_TRICU|nr:metallo-beta-lactamase domain-containing protein 1 [Trichonephila clavata]